MKVWFNAKKVLNDGLRCFSLICPLLNVSVKKSDFSQVKNIESQSLSHSLSEVIITMDWVESFTHNKKVGHLALWQPLYDLSNAKGSWCNRALPPGRLFLQAGTVERLAHPVKLLLQLTVHGRCGGGSRMWQNNPGINVGGRCMCFFSRARWHKKKVYVRSWNMSQSQKRAQLNRIKDNGSPPGCNGHDGILKRVQLVNRKEKIWHEEAIWEYGPIKVGICIWR